MAPIVPKGSQNQLTRALAREGYLPDGPSYRKRSNYRRSEISKHKQKLRRAYTCEATNEEIASLLSQDPRGPSTKEATHDYLDIDDMPYAIERAIEVQKLLKDDAIGLRAYEDPRQVCPLKFDLIRSALELKKSEIDACIGLVEMTSGDDYKASSIGWDPIKKKEEMTDREMIYLLIRQGDIGVVTEPDTEHGSQEDVRMEDHAAPQLNTLEQLIYGYASDSNDEEDTVETDHALNVEAAAETEVSDSDLSEESAEDKPQAVKKPEWPHPGNNGRIFGFISFMFTYDDPPHEDREVVYIYEIHLHERLRGRGLGSNLIKFVEHAAHHCDISKSMLTVFTANQGARALYKKLGYGKDECSPEDRVMRRKVIEADYMILSKELA